MIATVQLVAPILPVLADEYFSHRFGTPSSTMTVHQQHVQWPQCTRDLFGVKHTDNEHLRRVHAANAYVTAVNARLTGTDPTRMRVVLGVRAPAALDDVQLWQQLMRVAELEVVERASSGDDKEEFVIETSSTQLPRCERCRLHVTVLDVSSGLCHRCTHVLKLLK